MVMVRNAVVEVGVWQFQWKWQDFYQFEIKYYLWVSHMLQETA